MNSKKSKNEGMTLIRIDPDLKKKLRIHCLQNDITMKKYIEDLIRKSLKRI